MKADVSWCIKSAIDNNDLDTLKKLTPQCRQKDLTEYLIYAIDEDRVDVCEFLIKSGADCGDKFYRSGMYVNHPTTPLVDILRRGYSHLAEIAFKIGYHIDCLNDAEPIAIYEMLHFSDKSFKDRLMLHNETFSKIPKKTLIDYTHYAAADDDVDILLNLFSYGIRWNAFNKNGNTLLHVACSYGSIDVVKELLKRNCDMLQVNDSNETAIHMLFKEEHVFSVVRRESSLYRIKMEQKRWEREFQKKIDSSNRCSARVLEAQHTNREKQQQDLDAVEPSRSEINKINKLNILRLILLYPHDINQKSSSGNTPLHLAVMNNFSLEFIQVIINDGAEINNFNHELRTPLFYCHDKSVCEFILKKGAVTDVYDHKGISPLENAIIHGRFNVVEEMLAGYKSLSINEQHIKSIMEKIIENQLFIPELLNYIYVSGFNFDSVMKNGNNLFHCLCTSHVKISKRIETMNYDLALNHLEKDKPFNINEAIQVTRADILKCNDKWIDSIGYYPAEERHKNKLNIIFGIISYSGTDINAINQQGLTPLQLLIKSNHMSCAKSIILSHLIRFGVSFDVKDKSDQNIFHYMLSDMNVFNLMREHIYLIDWKLVNQKDLSGKSPLHYCSEGYFSEKALEDFINHTINIINLDIIDNDNRTPLHIAALNGRCNIVGVLLKYGASVLVKDNFDKMAIDYFVNSCFCGYCQCINSGEHSNIFNQFIIRGNDIDKTDYFLKKSYLIQIMDKCGWYGYMQSNSYTHLKLLIDTGIDINSRDGFGLDAIAYSCLYGNYNAFILLKEKGCSLTGIYPNNETLLHFAAVSGNLDIIKILLSFYSNVDIMNEDSFTPCFISLLCNNKEACQYFIKMGAKLNQEVNFKNNKFGIFHDSIGPDVYNKYYFNFRQGPFDLVSTLLLLAPRLECVLSLYREVTPDLEVNLNATDEHGWTSLHYAAFWGFKNDMDALIKFGVDPTIKSIKGETADEIYRYYCLHSDHMIPNS